MRQDGCKPSISLSAAALEGIRQGSSERKDRRPMTGHTFRERRQALDPMRGRGYSYAARNVSACSCRSAIASVRSCLVLTRLFLIIFCMSSASVRKTLSTRSISE